MKVLLVDHHDSFTYNLYQMLGRLPNVHTSVVHHEDDWPLKWARSFDAIILSPGPGDAANSKSFSRIDLVLEDLDTPVLGVCLGHQAIAIHLGGRVDLAPHPMHGRVSLIEHQGTPLFDGIPSRFTATR